MSKRQQRVKKYFVGAYTGGVPVRTETITAGDANEAIATMRARMDISWCPPQSRKQVGKWIDGEGREYTFGAVLTQ